MNSSVKRKHIAINQLHENEHRWFAVYCKYKSEKHIKKSLEAKKVHAYVPLLETKKVYVKKIKTVVKPLINCYVFVKIIKDDYIKVLETEHVIKFLKQRRDLLAIPESEIQILKMIVGEKTDLFTEELRYEEELPVEIIAGNLTGLKGQLIAHKGKSTFVVALENMGFSFSIDIEKDLLRAI